MGRVVHFEIQATNPQRAINFYENVFGWTFNRWGEQEYWLIETGPEEEPGINGGLVPRREAVTGAEVGAFVCTIDVESVDDTLKLIGSNGGQRVVPKTPVPGVGYLVYCRDPEGNLFGVMEMDEEAA